MVVDVINTKIIGCTTVLEYLDTISYNINQNIFNYISLLEFYYALQILIITYTTNINIGRLLFSSSSLLITYYYNEVIISNILTNSFVNIFSIFQDYYSQILLDTN